MIELVLALFSVELLSCIQPDLKVRELIQQSYTIQQDGQAKSEEFNNTHVVRADAPIPILSFPSFQFSMPSTNTKIFKNVFAIPCMVTPFVNNYRSVLKASLGYYMELSPFPGGSTYR